MILCTLYVCNFHGNAQPGTPRIPLRQDLRAKIDIDVSAETSTLALRGNVLLQPFAEACGDTYAAKSNSSVR
jgi:hypothetical protein